MRPAAWLAVVALLATATAAQYRSMRRATPHPGPRAVAVVENVAAGTNKPSSRYQIVPVFIFYQGQYYDASLYKAAPVPMALLAETTYDVEHAGDAVGTISVGSAGQTQGGWVGEGELKLAGLEPEHKATIGTVAGAPGSDERPRLRRGGSESSAGSASPAPQSSPQAPPPTSNTPSSPSAATPPSAPSSSSSPSPSSPPSPTAPSGTAAAPSASPSPAEAKPEARGAGQDSSTPDDPNRPKLQRGKPKPQPAPPAAASTSRSPATGSAAGATATKPGVAAASLAGPAAAATTEYVAISDVKASDPHSFGLKWSAAEMQKLNDAARTQAQAAVGRYIAAHFANSNSAAPGNVTHSAPSHTAPARRPTRTSTAPAAPSLGEVEVRCFDLDFDNDPEIVLTGHTQARSADGIEHIVFVTYVVRQEGGRDYHPLLEYITDDTRLDEFPRLTLIDAVDGDGDGIGELLFRSSASAEANGHQFRLYRSGPDRLRIVFDSRGAQD